MRDCGAGEATKESEGMSDQPDLSSEGPLEGLIEKPMHLMTPEELRQHVRRIQELRTSSQALNAFRQGGEKVEKPTVFDEF